MVKLPAISSSLAVQARQVLVRHVIDGLPRVVEQLLDHLQGRLVQPNDRDEAQRLDDARVRLLRHAPLWLEQSRDLLSALLKPHAARSVPGDAAKLELLEKEAVENQLLAARAALASQELGSEAWNGLRLRLQHLEHTEGLDSRDPVLPVNLMQACVEAWLQAGLLRADWLVQQDRLHQLLAQLIQASHDEANRFLWSRGVMPEIDFKQLLRRSSTTSAERPPFTRPSTGVMPQSGGADIHDKTLPASQLTHVRQSRPGGVSAFAAVEPDQKTETGRIPIANMAHSGAQQVAQRLTDFLLTRVPGWRLSGSEVVSPVTGPCVPTEPAAGPQDVAGWWRQVPVQAVSAPTLSERVSEAQAQARALKQAAHSDSDRAVIELVALIFEGILSEDRISPRVRLWFARLQLPVLRHALQDHSFLTDESHPARQLIDRLGACVLGFDPTVSLEAFEAEIKRIVQVVEQYPETGRRVFETVLKELTEFLQASVQGEPHLQRAATLATRLEQRGTLTVQYTIELRRLLGTAPLHDGLRDFLFRVWVEVMAQAAVAYGSGDARARGYRQLAAELLWAASGKTHRHDRAKVIARVPALMTQIQEGLTLMGLDEAAQQLAIQPVSEALAEAFVSKIPALDAQWLAEFSTDLGRLESVWGDADDPVPLDRESLECLLGRDASAVLVLPHTGGEVPPQWWAEAQALTVGAWFTLDHEGRMQALQLVWVSPRRQLFLWASASRRAFLLPRGRVAWSLKTGVLRPAQDEPLSQQATRHALEVLQAQPERLLA